MENKSVLSDILELLASQGFTFPDINPDEWNRYYPSLQSGGSNSGLHRSMLSGINNPNRSLPSEIKVNTSIKFVSLARTINKTIDETGRLEIISFLIFLSRKVITYQIPFYDLIKVFSSVILTREEDFQFLKEICNNTKLPQISNMNCVYIVPEKYSDLELLVSDSKMIRAKTEDVFISYKFYSFADQYCFYSGRTNGTKSIFSFCNHEQLLLNCIPAFGKIKSFNDLISGAIREKELKHQGNDSEPTVILNNENNSILISGASVPANAFNFYQPVLKWMEKQRIAGIQNLDIQFDLDFFDTQSSKMLFEIMKKSQELEQHQITIKIFWLYENGDVDLYEAGKDYSMIMNKEFEFVQKEIVK